MVDVKIAQARLEESNGRLVTPLELMYGPDATVWDAGSAPIRQAFVTLHTPTGVGNGIDWQIGQWDNLLGYEVLDSWNEGNWTRSYGFTTEPTEHVGLLASYNFTENVRLQLGVANELSPGTTSPFGPGLNENNRNTSGAAGAIIESKKAIVSLLTLTAPDSWGSLKGSRLYAGVDYGPGNAPEIGGTHNGGQDPSLCRNDRHDPGEGPGVRRGLGFCQ